MLASIIARCGCTGTGSTAQNLDNVMGADKAVYIKHHPDRFFFAMLKNNGYKVRALVTVRDPYCAIESRVKSGHRDIEYDYRDLFRSMPADIDVMMVPYEAIVLHGAQKIVEMLGLEYVPGEVELDNHKFPMVYDGNARYYGKTKPEDIVFYEDTLIWLPEKGVGFYPVTESPYNSDYFDKYNGYANSKMGKKLNEARLDFVADHYDGSLVDVGIGCGQFVDSRPDTFGFDIMGKAVDWLIDRELYVDPRYSEFPAASFWDSLEHMNNPNQILQYITDYVFVSMPIYDSPEHVMKSKHFRKDEHCLYFTTDGFVNWMSAKGFDLIDIDDFETRLGREDILSFAFKKTGGTKNG
jgi:hypothetical protein